MTEEILNLIKENVVQGRMTCEDEGLEEGMRANLPLPSLLHKP